MGSHPPPLAYLDRDYPYTPQPSRASSPVIGPRKFQDRLESHIWHLDSFTPGKDYGKPKDPNLLTIDKLLENQAKVKEMISGVDVKVIEALAEIEKAKDCMASQSTTPLLPENHELSSSGTASSLHLKTSKPSASFKKAARKDNSASSPLRLKTPKPNATIDEEDEDDNANQEEDDAEFQATWKDYLLGEPQREAWKEFHTTTTKYRELCMQKYKAEWQLHLKTQPVKTQLSIQLAKQNAALERNARLKEARCEEEKARLEALEREQELIRQGEHKRWKEMLSMVVAERNVLLEMDPEEVEEAMEKNTVVELGVQETRIIEALDETGC